MNANRSHYGLILMVVFSLIAPLMDSMAKLIGDAVAVGQIAATRFAVQSALLVPLAALMGWMHIPPRGEIGLHFVRAGLLLVATAFFFTAVRYMPIADAIAIFFVEPLILTLLGAWLLGEPVGPRRFIACGVGFAGAILIIRTSFQSLGVTALLPLVTAFCFAFYMVLTRRMAVLMHPVSLQAYTGLAALALAVPVLWAFDGSGIAAVDPVWPAIRELKLLAALGVIATLSHICISFALSLAPASMLAPMQYLEIVGATVLGYFIFSDFPDGLTFLGIGLIVGAGLVVVFRDEEARHRPTPAP